jgi:hypothetical protein
MRIDYRGLDMDSPTYEWGKAKLDELDRVMLPSLTEVAPITIATEMKWHKDQFVLKPKMEPGYWREVGSVILVFLSIAGIITGGTALVFLMWVLLYSSLA